MKRHFKTGVVILTVFLVSLYSIDVSQANTLPYQCGDEAIQGVISSSNLEETQLTIQLLQNGIQKYSYMPALGEDGSYQIPLDYSKVVAGWYTIRIRAVLDEVEDSREYEAFLSQTCEMCGNGIIEGEEQCEENADCGEQGVCSSSCSCAPAEVVAVPESVLTPELIERIKQYAVEAKTFFENNKTTLTLPKEFYKTGEDPTSWLESVVEKVGNRFAYSRHSVYNDIPDWTIAAGVDASSVSFVDRYAQLPKEYQDASGYLKFKGLFIPLLDAPGSAGEEEVLDLLNDGGVLAPQTENFDVLGVVKMLYAHSVSYEKSPFAGVGSYLSVFSEQGDRVEIFVRSRDGQYDKRTYSVRSKYQVDPSETDVLKTFTQEGLDLYSLITCKDGEVLGSTLGREVILLQRVSSELGSFQKAVISVNDLPSAREARKKIDAFLDSHDFSDEEVGNMILALEQAEEKKGGNPLTSIATYGKYMAAYDAVYNDGLFGDED